MQRFNVKVDAFECCIPINLFIPMNNKSYILLNTSLITSDELNNLF